MPEILLAETDEKCFKAEVDGTYIYFKETSEIEYKGQLITGKELYEKITNT